MTKSNLNYIINELKIIANFIKKNDLANYHSSLINLYIYIYKLKGKKLEYIFILLLPKIALLIKTNAEVFENKLELSRKVYIKKCLEVLEEIIKDCEFRKELK